MKRVAAIFIIIILAVLSGCSKEIATGAANLEKESNRGDVSEVVGDNNIRPRSNIGHIQGELAEDIPEVLEKIAEEVNPITEGKKDSKDNTDIKKSAPAKKVNNKPEKTGDTSGWASKETKTQTKKYQKEGYNYTETITTIYYKDKDGDIINTDKKVDVEKEKIEDPKPLGSLDKEYKRVVEGQNVQSKLEEEVLALINRDREKEGLTKLKTDSSLRQLARIKSADMILYNYFSHTSPNYGSFSTFAKKYVSTNNGMGENIMYTSKGAGGIHEGFMNSSGHRDNIMNPKYNQIGIGIIKEGPTYYITQTFRSK